MAALSVDRRREGKYTGNPAWPASLSKVSRSSLFAATDAAGVPDNVATQIADVFGGDIDFRRDLRHGDKFTVIYDMYYHDGRPIKSGRLLAAEFVAAAQVLVYIGAIVVLFLFGIMLTRAKLGSDQDLTNKHWLGAAATAFRAAYWRHRHAYDADLPAAGYWRRVVAAARPAAAAEAVHQRQALGQCFRQAPDPLVAQGFLRGAVDARQLPQPLQVPVTHHPGVRLQGLLPS